MSSSSQSTVNMWEEIILIPTYPIGPPDKNPMFLEKRVYQGSSGVVYPHPVIDKVYDHKEQRPYKAVFLENQYLKIMILPELGGRIQMALDKTNAYHFVYYNQVIKPALVGLAGPWISGGIEFNWPQHHRPSTFDPVDYTLSENPDGSKTVWVSEIEKMFHTKGMALPFTRIKPTWKLKANSITALRCLRPFYGGPTRPSTSMRNTSLFFRRMYMRYLTMASVMSPLFRLPQVRITKWIIHLERIFPGIRTFLFPCPIWLLIPNLTL